jgi:hypothetical protein
MAAAIMRMIDKNPENRFPSLKEAGQAVQGSAGSDEMAVASLGALAASKGQAENATPTPVPRRTPVSSGPTTQVRRHTALWFFAGTVAVVVIVIFGMGRLWGKPAPIPTAPVDSTLISARVSAIAARARVTAADLGASILASGDSIMSAGEAMADSGRGGEAAALFAAAAGVWDSALTQAARAVTRSPVPAAVSGTPRPAPVEAKPVDDSTAITAYYRELAVGIASRQVGEVRRLLPNLDSRASDAWQRLLQDPNLEKIEASYVITNLTRTAAEVHVRVLEHLSITKGGKESAKDRAYFATVTLGPQGWRQIREDK